MKAAALVFAALLCGCALPPPPPEMVPAQYDRASNRPPAYPISARRLGLEGQVILRVVVGEDGQAEKVDVRASSRSSILDQAALEAVRQWRFIPARRGDMPVRSLVDVPIRFRLEE